MKKVLMLILALSPFYVMAQTKTSDASTQLPKDALYILDGKKSTSADVEAIPPGEIGDVSIIKDGDVVAMYGADAVKGVLLVSTTKYLIASYQDKFSSFSDDYESYLTSHGTDDKAFIYVVNDVPLAKDRGEASTLYHIDKNRIESVTFVQDQPEGSKILAKVVIKTKK